METNEAQPAARPLILLARWFDPSSGASMEAEPIESPRSVGFRVPAIANAAGDSDWLLLLGQTEAAVAHQQQANGSLR